jgi:hypothetical protein
VEIKVTVHHPVTCWDCWSKGIYILEQCKSVLTAENDIALTGLRCHFLQSQKVWMSFDFMKDVIFARTKNRLSVIDFAASFQCGLKSDFW